MGGRAQLVRGLDLVRGLARGLDLVRGLMELPLLEEASPLRSRSWPLTVADNARVHGEAQHWSGSLLGPEPGLSADKSFTCQEVCLCLQSVSLSCVSFSSVSRLRVSLANHKTAL